ncbi:MAG TPA: hypothetical protein VJN21_09500 [Candidatus Acidoferrales bacterium]|nr:hypothetical protein [Candidatus Acidoferrales bacterium]
MNGRRATPTFMLLPLLASVLTCACSSGSAQGVAGSVDDFVKAYVVALNAKDEARFNSLIHPKSLACVTPENKDYYDQATAAELRDPIPADYKISVTPPAEQDFKVMQSYGEFPVHPTQKVQIEYQEGEDSGTIMLWLIQEKGRWMRVDPCASEQTLKEFKDDEPARKARIAKTDALAAAIQEPLRSQLKALLREHKTVTATKQYQQASGQDYETCMFVIYELTPEARKGQ